MLDRNPVYAEQLGCHLCVSGWGLESWYPGEMEQDLRNIHLRGTFLAEVVWANKRQGGRSISIWRAAPPAAAGERPARGGFILETRFQGFDP